MYKYLILQRLSVKGVNAQPAWWLVGAPGPVTYLGFAQDLAIKLDLEDKNPAVAIVMHDWSLRAEDVDWVIRPHQFRAAALINNDDYASGSRTLAGQPTVRGDMVVTVIVRIPEEQPIDLREVERILDTGRLAGGSITSHAFSAKGPFLQPTLEQVRRYVRSGFTLVDREDLMAAHRCPPDGCSGPKCR